VKKIRQNFEMSRNMWRKYKQISKKRARLDSSSHREESRKVPLTPAERAKAYRERKRMRALYQPSTSAAAFALNSDDETWSATSSGQRDSQPRDEIHTGSRLHPSQRAPRSNRVFHVSNVRRLL